MLIGGRTLRIDDPDLTPRFAPGFAGRGPDAVVLSRGDASAFFPGAKLFAAGRKAKTHVLCERDPGLPEGVKPHLLGAAHLPGNMGGPNAPILVGMQDFFKEQGYHSILVEGGAGIWKLFLEAGLWDRLFILTAPKLLPEGERWDAALAPGWASSLKLRKFSCLGEDYLTEFAQADPP